MYAWRNMSEKERREVLAHRRAKSRPWHTPPHRFLPGTRQYIISAACFEHAPIIGHTPERLDLFAEALLGVADATCERVYAWCVLPDHYHLVVQAGNLEPLLHDLGQLHGRTSFQWNGEEQCRGRKVWYNAVDREIRSERHLWASINYVHHNPVKHGYVKRWQDWPWSSAMAFLEEVGREQAKTIWHSYPVLDYGSGWDD